MDRTGSALRDALGIRSEERVLLLMFDVAKMIFAFFGSAPC